MPSSIPLLLHAKWKACSKPRMLHGSQLSDIYDFSWALKRFALLEIKLIHFIIVVQWHVRQNVAGIEQEAPHGSTCCPVWWLSISLWASDNFRGYVYRMVWDWDGLYSHTVTRLVRLHIVHQMTSLRFPFLAMVATGRPRALTVATTVPSLWFGIKRNF